MSEPKPKRQSNEAGHMPEVILARPIMGAQPQGGSIHSSGPWAIDNPYGNAVPYVRVDVFRAILEGLLEDLPEEVDA